MPELSIIVVNWNCVDYTRDCLASVFSRNQGVDFEVIVVDNASTKDDPASLMEQFPRIRLIRNSENAGFARANNLGFAGSSGSYVLFLNPDTIVLNDAIFVMLDALRSLPDAGVVGCKLLNSDRTIQTSCIQRFPTILNQALDVEALRLLLPRWKFWGTAPLFSDSLEPVPVEMISGACLMIRRDIFVAAGQFNQDYFMYAEDIDLCHSVKSLGWHCYYIGGARIIHHGGGSSRERANRVWPTVMARKAILQYCNKTHGPLYSRAYQLAMGICAVIRLSLLFPVLLIARMRGSHAKIGGTAAKWMAVLKWAIGMELSDSR
jgi:GT2 family glycosyltransferase